jgi:hypothetical protein
VVQAMNEINTARRLREAATEKAEANKILKVTPGSVRPHVHQKRIQRNV